MSRRRTRVLPVEGSVAIPEGYLLALEVELEARGSLPELSQGARLELAHALACDAEADSHLLERLRGLSVEAETQRHDAAHPRAEPPQRACQLARAEHLGGGLVRLVGLRVLDQVAVNA